MKPILLLFLPLAVGLQAGEQPPADLYTSYSGFAIPAEPVLPTREVHPSLWFQLSDLPALTTRLATDEFARTRLADLQAQADLAVPLPHAPTADDPTATIHKYYGAMSIAARIHAFLALVETDESTRTAHRQRAVDLLLRAYDGPIFQLDSLVKGSPVDEIYRGTWLQNYAAAYDCIQPTLPPTEDTTIRARLVREAECVYENLYRWTPFSPHNHLSKPAWGLGSIALALSSHPHARAWLARALEAANLNTRYFFSGDGIYREGSHYLIFSLTNFLPFLYHYRNVSGVDGFPAFQPVFEAMVEARNSHGWLSNIEDSYIRPTPTHLAAAAYRHATTRLHSSAPLAEILTWSYATADLRPFQQERRATGFNYTGASWDYPLELDELLTHDATIRSTAPDTAPNVFLTGGQTYLRDSWTNDGVGQRYLLFHGVAVADNHNHDDQLSFILEAEGQMMSSDSGYSRGTYAGAERTDWYVTAPAHNTLTFDGQAADATPSNRTPPSLFRLDQPGLVGEVKATDFGQVATWQRGIFWIAGDYYVVFDRVQSRQPGVISATLHGGRGQLTPTGGHYVWTYEADPYGPAAALHAWVAAPGATITEKSGELTYIKGDYATFPYLQLADRADHAAWLTLLKPASSGEAAPFKVLNLSTPALSALAIMAPAERTLVAGQATPGTLMKVGDMETDASFALVRRNENGEILNFCALEATYLRIAGQELWQSAGPQNIDSGKKSAAPAGKSTDAILTTPIVTVVDKGQPPPGVDVHDYVSFARYWWPDPTKPHGLPYIKRDGQHNRAQVAKGDHAKLFLLIATVNTLTTRWTESHDAAAAQRAVEWLRAWFIDPGTRMNPHLDYAQIHLGHDKNRGSPSGVLDARGFGELVESVQQLAETKMLPPADLKIIRQWFSDYLRWLTTAPNAKEEAAAENNHGTWYLAQVIPIARFVGQDELARQLCEGDRKRLISQIKPDGRQPFELTRADSLGYSVFNLEGQFRVAHLAARLGIDLWHFGTPKGGSLRQALAYLRPYNQQPEQWPHPQQATLKPGFLDALLAEGAQIWPQ